HVLGVEIRAPARVPRVGPAEELAPLRYQPLLVAKLGYGGQQVLPFGSVQHELRQRGIAYRVVVAWPHAERGMQRAHRRHQLMRQCQPALEWFASRQLGRATCDPQLERCFGPLFLAAPTEVQLNAREVSSSKCA